MRQNDANNPQLARKAQDVEAVTRREGSFDASGAGSKISVGRGGAANIVSVESDAGGDGEKDAQALREAEIVEEGRVE